MDVDIKTIAAMLLLGRLVSVFFMVLVVRRQRKLSKIKLKPELTFFRRRLNQLSIAVLVGNIIPIIIDVFTIVAANSLEREDSPSIIGVAYAFSNMLTSILSAFLIWSIYRQAERTIYLDDNE